MDIRYSHPKIARLWSREWTYQTWLAIEALVSDHQGKMGLIPRPQDRLVKRMQELVWATDWDAAIQEIDRIEEQARHDVVAFLQWARGAVLPGVYCDSGSERWIHFGLTSSDVVDTAQGMRFQTAHKILLDELGDMMEELVHWTGDTTPLLGRTHGQIAELIEFRARAWHWLTEVSYPAADLSRDTIRMAYCKLSGPVGTYSHNPPKLEAAVAKDLQLRPVGAGASQIGPRAPLAAWANSAAQLVSACAKIAHDIRLMHLTDEATVPFAVDQVGSSSMAHKKNPVQAEQVAGLARLARGYAAMLQPIDLWLERDMSHSSVERIAVPDLWHVTLHAVRQTRAILSSLKLDQWRINEGIESTIYPLVARNTLRHIVSGKSVDEARQLAMDDGDLATPEDAHLAMAHYPSRKFR